MRKNEVGLKPYSKKTQNESKTSMSDIKLKLSEENTGERAHDIVFANDFLNNTPKTQAIKVKIDTLNFIKI
jgi:hypothetical protein